MILSIPERLVALSILPQEGDYATLKILTTLKLTLSFTDEEFAQWGIVSNQETNRTTWKVLGEVDLPIGEKATDIIVNALARLNESKKLPANAMSLYEKFITDK
jgi:hypothetical protein